MITTKLYNDLSHYLKDADEIWVAVALVKEEAFEDFLYLMPETTKQNYLVGIDLPTTPSVLRRMKSNQSKIFAAAIYQGESTFHPKVYIIRNKVGLIAFIGSSNLTGGGMNTNIEMCIKVSDQNTCNSLLSWFDNLKKSSFPLTDENINSYEEGFLAKLNIDEQKKAVKRVVLKKPAIDNDIFSDLDFSDRYFKKEDHWAFRKELWMSTEPFANTERKEVSDRFMELHKMIYPQFRKYQLHNIYPNVQNHIVSLYYHNPERMQKLDAMWLSYGKSQDEIKEYHKLFPKDRYNSDEDDLQSFINHARLQIRIELEEIGIWILFGKNNNGSLFDRQYFKDHMRTDNYRVAFFRLVSNLPKEYWVLINQVSKFVTEFESPEELHEFCRKDRPENYFIIGRDYKISDTEMSELNLPQTVLNEFQRLYPIYELMRDKRFTK